jgi:hypothetical protein
MILFCFFLNVFFGRESRTYYMRTSHDMPRGHDVPWQIAQVKQYSEKSAASVATAMSPSHKGVHGRLLRKESTESTRNVADCGCQNDPSWGMWDNLGTVATLEQFA